MDCPNDIDNSVTTPPLRAPNKTSPHRNNQPASIQRVPSIKSHTQRHSFLPTAVFKDQTAGPCFSCSSRYPPRFIRLPAMSTICVSPRTSSPLETLETHDAFSPSQIIRCASVDHSVLFTKATYYLEVYENGSNSSSYSQSPKLIVLILQLRLPALPHQLYKSKREPRLVRPFSCPGYICTPVVGGQIPIRDGFAPSAGFRCE